MEGCAFRGGENLEWVGGAGKSRCLIFPQQLKVKRWGEGRRQVGGVQEELETEEGAHH